VQDEEIYPVQQIENIKKPSSFTSTPFALRICLTRWFRGYLYIIADLL